MLTVLVIDDEDSARDILINCVPWASLGVDTVAEACNGLHALDIAYNLKPDIILCDVKMPKMNGIEFAKRVSPSLPECKIIFLSAYSDKDYLKSAIMLKAVNYIEKPIILEEVIQTVEQAVTEIKNFKEKRFQSLPALRQILCQTLASGIIDMDIVLKQISESKLCFSENGVYISCVIQVYPNEAGLEEQCNKRVLEHFNTVFDGFENQLLYMLRGDGTIIIHFYTGSELKIAVLKSKLRSLIPASDWQNEQGYRLFIALGNEVTGLQYICNSYQNAAVVTYRQFFSGYNKLITYEEDNSTVYSLDSGVLRDFSASLKSSNKNEAISIVKQLVDDMRKHANTPPDQIREIFCRLTLIMSRFSEKMNIPLLNDNSTMEISKLVGAITLSELENNTHSLLNSIFSHLEAFNTSQDYTSKAAKYIIDNYNDTNLSVEQIAKVLYVSPNYLSSLFKSGTGKAISQFITDVRIERAAELLRTTDHKLHDISKSVGYNDGKYFSKVFEKVMGVKPKHYRGRKYD